MTHSPQEPPLLNTKALMERGWTRAGIKKFLGEPFRREQCHKLYTGDYIVNWYLDSDVVAAESQDLFKAFQAKKVARSEAARKGVGTKYEKTMMYVEELKIQLPEKDLTTLRTKACASYNSFAYEREREGGASLNSDPGFLNRITVNYIRHKLTSYEEELCNQFGRVGNEDAIEEIRNLVYTEISIKYPELADECHDQQARRRAERLSEIER
jgi:hypothetical protein